MSQHGTRGIAIIGCALLLPFVIAGHAQAQAVYGYANQQLTLGLEFSTAGAASLTAASANSDSEAEVHPATDDAPSQVFPPDVRQSVVGFMPGMAGVHGANPGENTYFRPGPMTGANWDPGSGLGDLNPGDDRSRADANVTAPAGLVNDVLDGGVTLANVTVANVAESVLNEAFGMDDASASASWDLTFAFDVTSGSPTISVSVGFVNELIGQVESGLVPPSHADAAFSFSASLVRIDMGMQTQVDLTPGVAGNSWVPAAMNNTIGVDPIQRFAALDADTIGTESVALAPGHYVLDLTGGENTFLQRQPGGPRHYQCYETHQPRLSKDVALNDRFGPSMVELRQPKRLCAPANKNGEDPSAPSDPIHLTAYTIRQIEPTFKRIHDLMVQNQFGTFEITLTRPALLLVPTAKDLMGPPPQLTMPPVDHFKCYRVSGARFSGSGLTVEDQFGPLVEDIKRPDQFCTPAEKVGEDPIQDANGHLMCYQTRQSVDSEPFQGPVVYTDNQFSSDTLQIFGPRELCVPTVLLLQ